MSYTYDAANRRSTMTVTGQATVSYTYDTAGRLTLIQQGSDTVTQAYDNAGRRTSLTLPNGVTTTSTYDVASRLTGLTYTLGATPLGTLSYAYDANGRRSQLGGTWARTGIPTAMSGATYNAANQQGAFNGHAQTFDLNGNLTSDGTTTYTWNARDQLVGLTRTGLTAAFAYDGTGRRQSTTINGTPTTFVYDGLNAVQETDPGGSATLLTGLETDAQLFRSDGSGSVALLTDALGSTIGLADATGAVTTTYTYDPFGATTVTGTSSANRTQYTGRDNDATGLYYYRARYYHPGLQRFLSEDPIGCRGRDLNLYSYVRNSPLNAVDPLGLQAAPMPLPVPIPLPPVFIPGTDQNREFAESTAEGLRQIFATGYRSPDRAASQIPMRCRASIRAETQGASATTVPNLPLLGRRRAADTGRQVAVTGTASSTTRTPEPVSAIRTDMPVPPDRIRGPHSLGEVDNDGGHHRHR